MIKNAGGHDEIVTLWRMFEPLREIAEKKFRSFQVEKLLHDKAAKKRKFVRLYRVDHRRALALQKISVRGFQRTEFENFASFN